MYYMKLATVIDRFMLTVAVLVLLAAVSVWVVGLVRIINP